MTDVAQKNGSDVCVIKNRHAMTSPESGCVTVVFCGASVLLIVLSTAGRGHRAIAFAVVSRLIFCLVRESAAPLERLLVSNGSIALFGLHGVTRSLF